jgi:hypothetical protein
MRVITLTSANYVPMTRLMLASVRAWHADAPVTCYALEAGWGPGPEGELRALGADVEVMPASAKLKLKSNLGWKLVVLARQAEPVLFLDSDVLALRPLDRAFEAVALDGWFSVLEGATLGSYYRGEIRDVVGLPQGIGPVRSFNTGVLGFDPGRFGDVVRLAADWGDRITDIWLGDQGLLNLAWYHLRGRVPGCGGRHYNGGWEPDGRFDPTQALLHFSEPYSPGGNPGRAALMQEVWDRWPKGVKLTPLTETDFWAASQPHPWGWVNQCNQRQFRGAVGRIRELSREHPLPAGTVVESPHQAYLLHREVRAKLAAEWADLAPKFAGLPVRGTYHLRAGGGPTSAVRRQSTLAGLALTALVR